MILIDGDILYHCTDKLLITYKVPENVQTEIKAESKPTETSLSGISGLSDLFGSQDQSQSLTHSNIELFTEVLNTKEFDSKITAIAKLNSKIAIGLFDGKLYFNEDLIVQHDTAVTALFYSDPCFLIGTNSGLIQMYTSGKLVYQHSHTGPIRQIAYKQSIFCYDKRNRLIVIHPTLKMLDEVQDEKYQKKNKKIKFKERKEQFDKLNGPFILRNHLFITDDKVLYVKTPNNFTSLINLEEKVIDFCFNENGGILFLMERFSIKVIDFSTYKVIKSIEMFTDQKGKIYYHKNNLYFSNTKLNIVPNVLTYEESEISPKEIVNSENKFYYNKQKEELDTEEQVEAEPYEKYLKNKQKKQYVDSDSNDGLDQNKRKDVGENDFCDDLSISSEEDLKEFTTVKLKKQEVKEISTEQDPDLLGLFDKNEKYSDSDVSMEEFSAKKKKKNTSPDQNVQINLKIDNEKRQKFDNSSLKTNYDQFLSSSRTSFVQNTISEENVKLLRYNKEGFILLKEGSFSIFEIVHHDSMKSGHIIHCKNHSFLADFSHIGTALCSNTHISFYESSELQWQKRIEELLPNTLLNDVVSVRVTNLIHILIKAAQNDILVILYRSGKIKTVFDLQNVQMFEIYDNTMLLVRNNVLSIHKNDEIRNISLIGAVNFLHLENDSIYYGNSKFIYKITNSLSQRIFEINGKQVLTIMRNNIVILNKLLPTPDVEYLRIEQEDEDEILLQDDIELPERKPALFSHVPKKTRKFNPLE